MATELAKAYVQIIPSAQGIGGSITNVLSGEGSSAGEKAGKNAAASFGKHLKGALIGLGLGKMIMDSIGNASEFETGMAKVGTLFAGTSEEFVQLQDDLLGLSSAYGISTQELTEAAYSAESAGVAQEDLIYMLEHSAELAKAGFTDLDTALSATAKTMNAYGEASGSAEDIQRVLIQTQNLGITTVGELGQSLSNITPTAAAMGVSFEQVGASLALMTAAGVPTAQATTQLRSAMTELGKAGTKADKSFRAATKGTKYAGMSFQEAMDAGADLGDVFGMMQAYADKSGKSMVDLWGSVEAGNAAMLIAADVEKFDDNLAQMATDSDVVGDAYKKMANTLGNSMNKLKTSASNFMTALFTGGDISASFDSMLESLGDVSGRLIDWLKTGLTTLADNLPNLMSSLLDFGGSLLEMLAKVNWIELGTTILNGVIGALGTLGQRLIELFGSAVTAVANGDINFGDIGNAIWNGVTSVITTAGGWLKTLFETAKKAVCGENGKGGIDFSGIGTAILGGVTSIIDSAGKFLATLFGAGVDAATSDEMGYSGIGTSILGGITQILDKGGEFLGSLFRTGLEAAEDQPWPSIGDAIKTGVNLVLNGGKFIGAIFEAGAELVKAIDWQNVGQHAEELIVAGLGGAAKVVNAVADSADRLLTSIPWEDIGQSAGELVCTGLKGAADIVSAVSKGAADLITGIEWNKIGESTGKLLVAGIEGAANIVSAVSKGAADLISGIDWKSIGESSGKLLNTGLQGSADMLETGFRSAVTFLEGVDWAGLGGQISSGLGDVWGGLTGFIGGTLSGAGELIEGAGSGAGAIFEAGGKWLANLIHGDDAKAAAEDLKTAMADLKKALEDGKKDLETTAKGVGTGIYTSLKTDLSPVNMNDIGKKIVTGIEGGIGLETPNLATKVSEIRGDIKKVIAGEDQEGYWSGAGEKIISGVETGIGTKFPDLDTKVGTAMDMAKKTIEGKDWSGAGGNIIDGIIKGINSKTATLVSTLTKVAEDALAAMKKALGISSPSKVMRDQVGRWIPAGIAAGIEGSAGLVDDAMDDLAGGLTSGRLRSSMVNQTRSLFGASGTGNGDDRIDSIAASSETQNALLREQNSLLRRILEKEFKVGIGASASLGRTVKQSLDMYSVVGG